MESSNDGSVGSSFCMLELGFYGDHFKYFFITNGKRFLVEIKASDLAGPGGILEEFRRFTTDLDDPDLFNQFEEWVIGSLHDYLISVAPAPRSRARQPITLLAYFTPQTYALKLKNKAGKLHVAQYTYEPSIHGDPSPRAKVVNGIHDAKTSPNIHGCILRSMLADLPRFLASEIEGVDDNLRDQDMSDMPRKVRRIGTSKNLFFKGAFKGHGYLREIQMLSRIEHALEATILTSRLAGVVMWDDDKDGSLMGLLIEYIEGQTLYEYLYEEKCKGRNISQSIKLKWAAQIESSLRHLHAHNIVWGDVKPENVMINSNNDAVIIDFGGGYTPAFVPRELRETVQGDLLGFDRLKTKWD
ncbi:hypothetical protein RRF57_008926 [Xylaria bambusicola]|uniref:Protein kinase domain-containing protein n=1 Tax=Xylaria bambusicola TaxID=326684 RepID=A0AAN7Z7F7_9PEZI